VRTGVEGRKILGVWIRTIASVEVLGAVKFGKCYDSLLIRFRLCLQCIVCSYMCMRVFGCVSVFLKEYVSFTNASCAHV